MALFKVDRRRPMFSWSQADSSSRPGPWSGKIPSATWSETQRRDLGMALLPRRHAALQLRREQALIRRGAADRQGDRAHPRIHDAAPGLLFPRRRTALAR